MRLLMEHAVGQQHAPLAIACRGNDIDLEIFGQQGALLHQLLGQADKVFTVSSEMASKVNLFNPQAKTHFIANGHWQ